MAAVSAASSRRPFSLRYLVSAIVTLLALAAALTQVDPGAFFATAAKMPATNLVAVGLLFLAGALISAGRLICVATDLGYPMRARDALAALSIGQIAGTLFFQVVGQVLARSAILGRRGMPVAGTILLTGYERFAALAVSLGFATIGGWHLFGQVSIDLQAGGAVFVKLLGGGAITLAAGAMLAWGGSALAFARAKIRPGTVWRLGRILLLSIAIQLATMAAYIAAAVGLVPDIGMGRIAAAAAIVMLAASLPISLAGWGIRELSAIYTLGIIGFDREEALVVGVVIGTVSLVVMIVLAAVSMIPGAARKPVSSISPDIATDPATLLAWCIPVLAATAIFFQVHVPLSASALNVNLADPIAITGGALFVFGMVRNRMWPAWRLPGLNAHVVVATIVLILAFLHGVVSFGWTSWAFTNKLTGWFILLAYGATGALIVTHAGKDGLDMLLRTFAAAAVGIVVLDTGLYAARIVGAPIPLEVLSARIDGFSQNPNALAFLLLLACGAIVATFRQARMQAVLLGIVLIGLWLAGSRAAFGALVAVALAAILTKALSIRTFVLAALGAAASILVIDQLREIIEAVLLALRWILALLGQFLGTGFPAPALELPASPSVSVLAFMNQGVEVSNVERWESIRGGWEMFGASPLFGAGLGAFVESYFQAHGKPLLIHSTPIWLLAEAGAIGFLAFAAPFIRMLKYEIRYAPHDGARAFIIITLVAFAVMSQVHEMLYQRALWLLLGAALACAPKPRAQTMSA